MVSRQVFSIVAGTKTAHEAWAKLRAVFQLTGFWHRTGLTRQLYSIKQQPRESDIAYIARAADLRNQLEAAGCSEGQMEGFAAAALSGLRLDFSSLVMYDFAADTLEWANGPSAEHNMRHHRLCTTGAQCH